MKHLLLYLFAILSAISSSLNAQQDSALISDHSSLISFIDSLIDAKIKEYNIPGATVAIVIDSQSFYTQGYGFADLENQKKVDTNLTGFRIASITKTFTAVAAMQLVENGLLDLHTDIRNYLPDDDFDFLDGSPITMHHLLTHTAGFDVTDTGDASKTPEDIIPIETIVRRHLPAQVHPPGTIYSYSNFGYTLAGYIIEQISGMPYKEYIQKHIFKPLGMNNSSLDQPLKETYRKNLAKAYKWDDGYIILPRDYTNTLPGGGIISTGSDMLRYMTMHLNKGTLGSVEILSPASHAILTSQHYGSSNTRRGICYAFFETIWQGRRALDHTGGQLGFLSIMELIPEEGFGLFISHNSRKDAGDFRYDILTGILDTIMDKKSINFKFPKPLDDDLQQINEYEGTYTQMDHPYKGFEKIALLFGFFTNSTEVTRLQGDTLSIWEQKFVPVGNDVFQHVSNSSSWNFEFIRNYNGKVVSMMGGINSYKLIPWYQKTLSRQLFFGIPFLILLLYVLSRPFKWIYSKMWERSFSTYKDYYLKWMYWTSTILSLGFMVLLTNFMIYEDQLSDYGIRLVKVGYSILITSIIILAINYWNYNIVLGRF